MRSQRTRTTDRRLKILVLTHNLAARGGSWMRSFSLARQLAAFGHSVTLGASRSDRGCRMRRTVQDGVVVLEMPDWFPERIRNGGLSPPDVLGRIVWVRANRFDVVHGFDHRPAVSFPGLAARVRGAVLISDWADLWGEGGIAEERRSLARVLGRLDHFWERRFRRWADGATVITSDLGRRLEALGVPATKQFRLPPGANVDLIRTMDRGQARRDLGLPEDVPIAAFTGFAPYDSDLLLEVVTHILRAEPKAMVVASGRLPDGLRRSLRERGLDARLRDLGVVASSALEKVLGCADVLLLPYTDKEVNRGRFPNRFGDYLAAGRAIVTNRTGDLGAMAEAEGIAVLAPEAPDGFGREVVALLHDAQRRAEYGLRARAYAESTLNWETLARRVETFYFDMMGIGGAP